MRLHSTLLAALCTCLARAQQTPDLVSLLTSPAAANLSTLTTLVQSNPALLSALGSARNITILAPNNDAFNALNQSGALRAAQSNRELVPNLLSYHVLQGTTYASGFTSNPIFAATMLNSTEVTNVTGGQHVEARLIGQDVLLTSGLNTLDTLKDVTVFAPNNAAFDAIGSVLGPLTTEQLVRILGYHIVNGTVGYSSSLSNTSLTTLEGSRLNVTVSSNGVFVNSARVINTDILVANGIVHVIDGVLNPNSTNATPPSGTTTTVAFPGASSAPNGLTSGIPPASTTISQLTATTNNIAATSNAPAPSSTLGSGAGILSPESWTGMLAIGVAALVL